MLHLRPYQEDAIAAIADAAERGVQRPLVVHPTGAGKTVTFAHLLSTYRAGRGLVLVHRDELVNQTINKLRMIAPELTLGVVKAERNELRGDVVVASVQTACRPNRLAQLTGFSTLVVDEAHHAAAETWSRVLRTLGSFTPGGPLTVGFTATPERADGALGVWEEVVAFKTIREMVYEGYLCDVIGERVDTSADFSHIRKSDGDLGATQLGKELTHSGAIGQIAAAVLKYAADRKSVAFLPTVATAQSLAAAVSAIGIPAEAIWGAMPYEERRLVLKRLHTGETRFVSNCAVLTEGFDEPSVDCIVIARPTSSHGLYVQMVGRGLRNYPGKPNCLLLDVVGATERHDLVGVIDLGLATATGSARGRALGPAVAVKNPCELCGRPLALTLVAAGKLRHNNCRAGGTTRAQMFGTSRLNWLEVDGGYCLAAGKGAIVIVPEPDTEDDLWRVLHHGFHPNQLTIQQRVPIEWAQGIGEDRTRAFETPNERKASWRRLPPTASQLTRLRNYGLSEYLIPQVKTRGDAADLITRKIGRTAIRQMERGLERLPDRPPRQSRKKKR